MIEKLRIKFVCVNMIITLCMLVVLFTLLTGYVHKSMVKDRVNMLHRIAEEPVTKYRPSTAEKEKASLSYFTLERDTNGELRASGDQIYDLSDEAELHSLYDRVCAQTQADGVLKDANLRYTRVITPRGAKLVFADMSAERATDRYLVKVVLLSGFGAIAVFFGISLALSSWAVHPVEVAWKQQKQFVADASHELKTPLTVIISNAELLQQPGYDEKQRKKFSESILVMSRQMRHLVDSLLNLARLDSMDATAGSTVLEALDFSALVEDCILPFEPLFFERGLTLESKIEPCIRLRGNERALHQCMDILLDNAQKYSKPGTVRLSLRRQGRSGELTVSNPSTELSKSECAAVFRRFYRRDEARTVSGSYGLGLPIAQGIIIRHGGKIECSWEAGEICFTVNLPII